MSQTLVLASHNAHKLEELRRILGPLIPGVELVGYDGPEPVESGISFEENALLKARAAAARTGLPAIADDSGLAVDVLGGCPGIFSARWGGPARSDAANVELLLWQLTDVADEHRAAGFVCAAALALPGVDGEPGGEVCELGVWQGSVLREPAGENGFGYDPIFRPEGEQRSAAELGSGEKDRLSHRTRAFSALAPEILTRLQPGW
ncbi:RdgB/HAM1 family non-canonical purine NTP pyrophosphatase [Leucobacter sp. wl10]|uniref:RdgB/HAM1 family non-canonical purine NTP pyrophosphatase n=1 Tax=Leucobacter sp. wl10 TaxID=2304677 RepID=UPI000E5C1C93|nr:RdgB/HAM1 family non-canonical purine NTP pyrophosphatase [Leucobacter sp. wl10]RGE22462.1 RdgB/HAM1 family non-canonical purine NTP pyrophosphatase [Leucobacter sp. wl10]